MPLVPFSSIGLVWLNSSSEALKSSTLMPIEATMARGGIEIGERRKPAATVASLPRFTHFAPQPAKRHKTKALLATSSRSNPLSLRLQLPHIVSAYGKSVASVQGALEHGDKIRRIDRAGTNLEINLDNRGYAARGQSFTARIGQCFAINIDKTLVKSLRRHAGNAARHRARTDGDRSLRARSLHRSTQRRLSSVVTAPL